MATTKDPWKGSKVNSVLYLNNSMPWIEIQKVNESQNILEKAKYIKTRAEPHQYAWDCQSSSLSVRWNYKRYLSHKRTLWIEDLELKFRKKGKQEDSKEDKSPKAQKVQNGMGMRNKWIFIFTICYNLVVSELEATWRQR